MFKGFLILNVVFDNGSIKIISGIIGQRRDLIDAVAYGRFVMLCVAPGAGDYG